MNIKKLYARSNIFNKIIPAVAVPLDPLANYIYIQHETSRICLQPRPSFAWILPLRNIIFPIIDQ